MTRPRPRLRRGQRLLAGPVAPAPAVASAAVTPCRDMAASHRREKPAATAPADQSNQAGSYKEAPAVPALAAALPFVPSRSRARVTGALLKQRAGGDPIPFASSSTRPRYSRVSPLLSHRFDRRKERSVVLVGRLFSIDRRTTFMLELTSIFM